jgi:hypothetical protein
LQTRDKNDNIDTLHQASIRQPNNSNFDFDMLSAANSIEHIAQQEEQNNNLLFYNFNNTVNQEDKTMEDKSRQKLRLNYKDF